jgi:lysophospholipase L1-like esterase
MRKELFIPRWVSVVLVLVAAACFGQEAPSSGPAAAAPVLQTKDRIVVIGDSITGLGERAKDGFVHLMREALAAAHKDSSFELVGLGASGWAMPAWEGKLNQKRGPKDEWFTDVPNVGVNATLDKPVDVVIIMLGANDVLRSEVGEQDSPYQQSLDHWEPHYVRLIETLRARTHARVVALAQCTLVGGNADLPINRFFDKLNGRIAAIAKKTGCLVLPTNDECKWMILRGRRIQSDFQITYDLVHPNSNGHAAIAMGMLKGLDEALAAEHILTKYLWPMTFKLEINDTKGYELTPLDYRDEVQQFRVRYWWPFAPKPGDERTEVRITVPQDWTAKLQSSEGLSGEFLVSGKCDRLKNVLTMEGAVGADKRRVEIVVPAPWLLAAGPVHPWSHLVPMVEKDVRTAIDDAIEQGKDFTAAIDLGKTDDPQFKGRTLRWKHYFATIDNFGGPSPLVADFYGVTNARAFETGYGARWVYSDRDRPIRLELFAPPKVKGIYLFAWLNGKKEYSGQVDEAPGGRVSIKTTLKKGWNPLAFRLCRWQSYEVGIELLPVGEDNLADLRYSSVPKK